MASRKILPVESLSEDAQKFFDVLNSSSDLAVVLVAVSYLDASLGALLHRFLIESSISDQLLDIRSGPLGTFAARADAAYTLALIDKSMYQDLTRIAEIRNEFAHHHLELDFNSPAVAQRCEGLQYVASLRDGTSGQSLGLDELMTKARDRFVISVVMLSQRLLLNGLGVKRRGSAV